MAELAPFTLDGWYALHQVLSIDWRWALSVERERRSDIARRAAASLDRMAAPPEGGWSAAYQLVGGGADVLVVHFRPTLELAGRAGLEFQRCEGGALLRRTYEFTSVTEAALYNATLEAAQEATPGSQEYGHLLEQLAAAERAGPRMATRLYPPLLADMRYISFYPMSKRRSDPDNWYMLPLAERSRLMTEHGLMGRRYAGRIMQVITGAVGLDDWEWGVTLFARDPLEFKRILADMRYDEVSARYAEFGPFRTGFRLDADGWVRLLEAD